MKALLFSLAMSTLASCSGRDRVVVANYRFPDDGVNPKACVTYPNIFTRPIKCRLEATAQLADPVTGFTKEVSDVRDEVIFHNSNHEVCFNFAKDEYDGWLLLSIETLSVACEPVEEQDG